MEGNNLFLSIRYIDFSTKKSDYTFLFLTQQYNPNSKKVEMLCKTQITTECKHLHNVVLQGCEPRPILDRE